jgi:glycosyltransferase involved in cell wall biosynthesis
MAAMDLIVLPSFHEAMPLVMLEAMAIGVPVVASRVAGIPEIITDGVTGLLVEPGDVNGIAAAIIRLLQDPGLARTIGGNGRARVEEELNVERMLDGVRRVYAEVSEEHGAPGN